MNPSSSTDAPSPRAETAATRLLSVRWASVRRRLQTGSPLLRLAAFVLVPATLAALVWALHHMASGVLGAGTDGVRRLREHVFWLNAGPVLIWSYTTFEVIFRSRDALYLNTLPIRGATRSVDILLRTYATHLPLALPGIIYGVALLFAGGGSAGVYAMVVAGLTYAGTLAVAVAVHLAAGRTLLTDATAVRKLMAGQIVASEDAMLLWSPAGGLVVGLILVVINELLLFHGMLMGRGNLTMYPYIVTAVVTLVSVRAAHQAVVESFHGIIARFAQAEIPPPYTDEGVPERTRGEGLVKHLPAASRPYFLRDRRQLRRRYRIDTVVIVLFAVIAGRLALAHEGDSTGRALTLLIALAAVVGLLLTSAFRTRGELAAPYLDSSLPSDTRAERVGRLAAAGLEPLSCALVAGLATLVSGDMAATAMVTLGGLVVVIALIVGSDLLAARMRLRAGWAAAVWRVGILATVALATGLTSGQGGVG